MSEILLLTYSIFISSLFISNDILMPQNFFLYTVVPVAFMPIDLNFSRFSKNKMRLFLGFSFENPKRTLCILNSKIFLLVSLYSLILCTSSALAPFPSASWMYAFAYFFISVSLFMLITARLFIENGIFSFVILKIIIMIASLNVVINLYLFFYVYLGEVNLDSRHRLFSQYGVVPDHYPTTSGLFYGLMTLIAGFVSHDSVRNYDKKLFASAGFVFLFATLLTQSRGSLLVLVFLFLLFFRYQLSNSGRSIFAAFFLFTISFFPNVIDLLYGLFYRGMSNRIEIWQKFIQLANIKLVTGYGMRIEFLVELLSGEKVGLAHNLLLGGYLRGGIFAFLFLLLSFILCFYYSLLTLRSSDRSFFVAIFVIIFTTGLFDFELLPFIANWQWICFYMPFSIFIALELITQKLDLNSASCPVRLE